MRSATFAVQICRLYKNCKIQSPNCPTVGLYGAIQSGFFAVIPCRVTANFGLFALAIDPQRVLRQPLADNLVFSD
jgi:hypothetical protein